MSNNAQEQINLITNKAKIRYLDISNRDLNGEVNLKEFTSLTSLNSYNNKFESLDFLNTLPNKEQLKKLPKNKRVVIYCGCCPFEHCPNVRPAIQLLKQMKFTNYRLLDLPKNIKIDWIDKGYPTVTN